MDEHRGKQQAKLREAKTGSVGILAGERLSASVKLAI
jgi:hypothetical protein